MSLQSQQPDGAKPASPFAGGLNSSNPRIQRLIAAGPKRATVLLVLVGMMIGMATAYVIIPTEFTGASPRRMSQQAVLQWARMVAVGHSQDVHYDDSNALLILRQIPNPHNVVEGLAGSAGVPAAERAALNALTEIDGYANLVGPPAPQDPGLVLSSLQIVLALAAVALAIPILTIAGRMAMSTREAAGASAGRKALEPSPARSQVSPSAEPAAQSYQAHSEAPAARWVEDETEQGGSLHPHFGAPILHTVSSYMKGQNYDDSFAIETSPDQGSQFLGECGVSAATRVGNELQSVEFWGFDMASQETMTKVFAAPAALSDPALVSAVANRVGDPANDIAVAEPGARLFLDGSAIQIQAEIKSVVCNYGGGTPNSGIESMQIEMLGLAQADAGGVAARGRLSRARAFALQRICRPANHAAVPSRLARPAATRWKRGRPASQTARRRRTRPLRRNRQLHALFVEKTNPVNVDGVFSWRIAGNAANALARPASECRRS